MPLASAARADALRFVRALFRVGARFTRRRRAFAREPRAFVSSRGRSTGTHALKSRAFHRERRVRDHLAGRTAEFLVRAVRVYGLAAPPRRRLDVAPQTAPHRTRGVGDDATVGVAILAARVAARDATVVAVLHVRRHRPSPSSEFQALHPRRVRGHVQIRALETHAHAANAGARRRKRFGLLRARLAAYARLGPPAAAARTSFAAGAAPRRASAAAAATALARAITSRRRAVSGVTDLFDPPSFDPAFRLTASSAPRVREPPATRATRAASSSSDVHDDGAVDASVRRFALPTGAGAAATSRFPRGAPAASPRDGGMCLQLAFSNASDLTGQKTLEDALGRAKRSLALPLAIPDTPRAHAGPSRACAARARRVHAVAARGAC